MRRFKHMSKYRNIRTAGGASKAESARRAMLEMLERRGEIFDLRCQPSYTLAGCVRYRADFEYRDAEGRCVTEDVKGFETERFRVVRQLWRIWGPWPLRIVQARYSRGTIVGFETRDEITPTVGELEKILQVINSLPQQDLRVLSRKILEKI